MIKRGIKILRNLFGVAICALFLTLSVPVRADLLFENLEVLTNDEINWDLGDCVRASGFCFMNGVEHGGVALPPN